MPSRSEASLTTYPQLANRILRAESATANGLENLPLFAGGVVAVNVATASPSTSSVPIINALCFAYLALRTAYNVVYVWGQEDRRLALLQSATWIAGSMCAMALWIMAGFAAMSNSSR